MRKRPKRPSKITEAMRERITEVGRQRQAARALPTNKQLAAEAGISERGVAWIMRQQLLRANEVPRLSGTPDEVAEAVMLEFGL